MIITNCGGSAHTPAVPEQQSLGVTLVPVARCGTEATAVMANAETGFCKLCIVLK